MISKPTACSKRRPYPKTTTWGALSVNYSIIINERPVETGHHPKNRKFWNKL